MEKDAFRFAGENEKLKRSIESMQEELDTLRKDAAVMRSILDRASISASAPAPQPEKTKYIPKNNAKVEEEAVQLSAFDKPTAQPVAPVPSVEADAAPADSVASATVPAEENSTVKKAQKPANKNRVGNMFDLLTFSDV